MAKVRFGNMTSDVRKSIGAITYSRNRFGAYTRPRTAPIQSRTALQLARRAEMSDIASAWRALSSADQLSWNAWADAVLTPRTDSMGQEYRITGNQAFVGLNMGRRSFGLAANIDTPPGLPAGPITASSFTMTADSAPAALTLDTLVVSAAADNVQIWATAPSSPGRNFFVGHDQNGRVRGGDYKLIYAGVSNPAMPFDLLAAYEAVFGTVDAGAAGKKISFIAVPYGADYIAGVGIRLDSLFL